MKLYDTAHRTYGRFRIDLAPKHQPNNVFSPESRGNKPLTQPANQPQTAGTKNNMLSHVTCCTCRDGSQGRMSHLLFCRKGGSGVIRDCDCNFASCQSADEKATSDAMIG